MASHFDTIVAPLTARAPAAVALVRVSGPEAFGIASSVFSTWPASPQTRHAVFGRLATGDEGLAMPFAEGQGYTGEESVEFSLHGSLASVDLLVEACVRAGARLAEPGEFTQRAFMNGKLDLTQAEAVAETISARTSEQLKLANFHRQGALRDAVGALRKQLTGVLAAVEASVDFSEEVGELDRNRAFQAVDEVSDSVDRLLGLSRYGRMIRQGVTIAIVGRPNAGKSSLLNAILGSERAIVTAVPGTTRDYIEESVDLGGVPCVFIDTAGLRETQDEVESIGVERSLQRAAEADIVWYVYDASLGLSAEERKAAESYGERAMLIANKVDLIGAAPVDGYRASTLQRQIPGELSAAVLQRVNAGELGQLPWPNTRQTALLQDCREALDMCRSVLQNDLPDDLLSTGLQQALHALGEITGDAASADLLESIFRDFCIGK